LRKSGKDSPKVSKSAGSGSGVKKGMSSFAGAVSSQQKNASAPPKQKKPTTK